MTNEGERKLEEKGTEAGRRGGSITSCRSEGPARSDDLILCLPPGCCPASDPCLRCFLMRGWAPPKGWQAVAASKIGMVYPPWSQTLRCCSAGGIWQAFPWQCYGALVPNASLPHASSTGCSACGSVATRGEWMTAQLWQAMRGFLESDLPGSARLQQLTIRPRSGTTESQKKDGDSPSLQLAARTRRSNKLLRMESSTDQLGRWSAGPEHQTKETKGRADLATRSRGDSGGTFMRQPNK